MTNFPFLTIFAAIFKVLTVTVYSYLTPVNIPLTSSVKNLKKWLGKQSKRGLFVGIFCLKPVI